MDFSALKPKVMIVDDEPINIKMLTPVLRNDFDIIIATNGSEALERVQAAPDLDLILLDVMMPDIDGYSVCKKLKANEETKNIPVIFLTAKTDDKDETRGLECGAVDYIKKPFNTAIVSARVQTHVELKRNRDFIEALLTEKTVALKEYEKEYLRLFSMK